MGKRSKPTSEDLSLFDQPDIALHGHVKLRQKPKDKRTIQQRFDDWIVRHPEIEELSVKFSRELRQAGHKKYGIKAVLERIRWHYATRTDQAEDFKISNDYTSRMARFLMDKYPELEGFFNLRELRQD